MVRKPTKYELRTKNGDFLTVEINPRAPKGVERVSDRLTAAMGLLGILAFIAFMLFACSLLF